MYELHIESNFRATDSPCSAWHKYMKLVLKCLV